LALYLLASFMVKLQSVTKKFGNTAAVNRVSFEVGGGEVVGFLGPNGAGKTTTMRLITGYLAPNDGQVLINGQDAASHPVAVRRVIGYLPEGNPLYKDLKAIEMLELTARLKDLSDYQPSLKKVIMETGIGDVLERTVGELSKGFRQRVGLACALLGDPNILILDEPTEGLDPNQRHEIHELIKEMGKDKAVILSTHILEEATAICGRIIVINKGVIVSDGTVEELSRPSSALVSIRLIISGQDFDPQLIDRISGVASIEVLERNGDQFSLNVAVGADSAIQPELTRLAGQHNWTVWELTPCKKGLEEIFRELTN